MNFSIFRHFTFAISLRYIRKRMITWFSILGIALGVMVLIVVLAVMDGFRTEFISRLQGVLSHIIITVRSGDRVYTDLEKDIRSIPGVQATAPHLRGVILIATNQYYVGGLVIGMDYDKECQVGNMQNCLVTAHKEVRLWAEQLLEDNIRSQTQVLLSWKLLGGKDVPADGRFPAGMRLICQQTFTYITKQIPKGSLPSPDRQTHQYLAYTISPEKKVIFIESFSQQEAKESAARSQGLSAQEQTQWQKYLESIANALNSRQLNEFMAYFGEDLRLASGSIDPQKPFVYIPDDPDEIITNVRPILVGYELMRQLNLKRGEEITLMTGKRNPQDGKLNAFSRKFMIVGAFKTGWQEIDAHLVYTQRKDLLDFLDITTDVNEISVALHDYQKADEIKAALDKKLNKDELYLYSKSYQVQKWEELRKSLLSAIRLERMVMAIIVSLIVLLAVVSIMIILILLVTEKTKDIGILKALGATNSGIMAIFIFNGLFISFFGSILGSGLGIWFSLKINTIADIIFERTGFRLFPRDVYYLDQIPIEFSLSNVIVIVVSTLVFTLLFCSIPALKAARMDAIEALNSESPSLKLWNFSPRRRFNGKTRKGFFGVEDLAREYIMGNQTLRVFENLNLEVKQGEILVILGASGVGKSTLLHIMGLLDTPTEGLVYYNGINLNAYDAGHQANIRNSEIGFVFQFYHLLPEFTALENVMLAAMIHYNAVEWKLRRGQIQARAIELLGKVGLAERMQHRPIQLSGGERQRVAIARALMMNPKIVLCDEPTGNLDEKNSAAIQELLWQLNKDLGLTLIIVTHEEHIARSGHRVLRLEHGCLNPVSFAEQNK